MSLVGEDKNEEHSFVVIELLLVRAEVQGNFSVYLHFRMLMNNRMMMNEQEYHYHVMMELLFDRILLVIDDELQDLVILFVNR